MRFVIQGQEYGDTSCGVRCLNRLCHWLNVYGHDASIGGVHRVHPDWEVALWDGIMTPETIAIYPEITWGNPYDANRVVRWALYHPAGGGHANEGKGPSSFGPHDKVFYYASLFEASTKAIAPHAERLLVSVFEPEILYSWEGPRTQDAFWVGRGGHVVAANPDVLPFKEMYEFWPGFSTRAALAKQLRRTRNFYCLDELSAFIPEALMCGCRTFIVNLDGTIREVTPAAPECFDLFAEPKAYLDPADVRRFLAIMEAWDPEPSDTALGAAIAGPGAYERLRALFRPWRPVGATAAKGEPPAG